MCKFWGGVSVDTKPHVLCKHKDTVRGREEKEGCHHRSQGAVRAKLDAAFAVCRQSITEVPTIQLGEYAHHLLKIHFVIYWMHQRRMFHKKREVCVFF